MTQKQDSDQQLKDDVTELKVKMNQVVEPALIDIKSTLSNMAFVPMGTYVKDMKALLDTIRELQAFKELASPAVRFYNIASNRFVQLIVIAILGLIVFALTKQIPLWIGAS